MFGKLLPRQTCFFDFFDEHARLTVEGVGTFRQMVQPGADRALLARRIKEIEHQCDHATHGCVAALHRTFITPIERNDIFRLISAMDDVMDNIEATSERIVLYDLVEMRPEVGEMVEVLIHCSEAVQSAVAGLRSMKNAAPILATCVRINELENQADAILRSALAAIFRQEAQPLLVIKWKEVFEYLESASDCCEDVAQIVEGVVLEHG